MVAGRVEEGAVDEAGGQDVEEGGGEKQTLVVGMGDDQQDAIGASEVGTDPPFALERVGGAVGTQAAVGRPVLADQHEGIDAETDQEYEPQEVFQGPRERRGGAGGSCSGGLEGLLLIVRCCLLVPGCWCCLGVLSLLGLSVVGSMVKLLLHLRQPQQPRVFLH